jgi:hypothetical protein
MTRIVSLIVDLPVVDEPVEGLDDGLEWIWLGSGAADIFSRAGRCEQSKNARDSFQFTFTCGTTALPLLKTFHDNGTFKKERGQEQGHKAG